MNGLQDNLFDISLSNYRSSNLKSKSSLVSVKQLQYKPNLVKRPSDYYLNKNKSFERPKSGDSILSIQSISTDCSEINDSRLSSLTSCTNSNQNSPLINKKFEHFPKRLIKETILEKNSSIDDFKDTKRLTKSKSISSLPFDITNKQIRKVKSRNSLYKSKSELKAKQSFYDDDDDFIIDNDYLLTFNVPLTQSNYINKSQLNIDLNPLPLPGKLKTVFAPIRREEEEPISPTNKSLTNLSPIAQNLSKFNDDQIKQQSKQQIEKRESLNSIIPTYIKQQNSVEDLILISSEKLKIVTQSRPVHLPPKPNQEVVKHDKEINNIMQNMSLKLLQNNKKIDENMKKLEILEKNWYKLNEIDTFTSKNLNKFNYKELMWKCLLPDNCEYEILLKFTNYHNRHLNQQYEPFSILLTKYHNLSTQFKQIQDSEFNKIINHTLAQPLYKPIMTSYKAEQVTKFKENYKQLLYFKLLSSDGLHKHDELVLIPMCLVNFNNMELNKVYDLIMMVNLTILNKSSLNKLNYHLSNWKTNSKVLGLLTGFGDDEISGNNFLKSIYTIINTSLKDAAGNTKFIKFFIQTLIMSNNLKIIECFNVAVLKKYHFGFNNFNELIKHDHCVINLINLDSFIEYFAKLYKKL